MISCIIFYEHPVRELDLCQKIKEKFAGNQSCSITAEVFSIRFQWIDAIHFAKKNGVDLILLPWLRMQPHTDYMAPFIRINPNVSFMVLNHEQLGSELSMRTLMPKTPFTTKNAYQCAWTQSFADELIASGVPPEHITITGNARLAAAKKATYSRSSLSQTYGLNPNKPWVLFCESRNIALFSEAPFVKKLLHYGLSQAEIKESQDYCAQSYLSFLQELRTLPRSVFSQVEFIYRLHPGQQLEEEIPSEVKLINDLPLSEWLTNVDLFMAAGSTSVFEAEIAQCPILLHFPVEPDYKYIVKGTAEYPFVTHLADAFNRMPIRVDKTSEKVYEKYVGCIEEDVPEKILLFALSIIDNKDMHHTAFDPINHLTVTRKYLFEVVTKAMNRVGLVEKLRWPRSAYRHLRDMPD